MEGNHEERKGEKGKAKRMGGASRAEDSHLGKVISLTREIRGMRAKKKKVPTGRDLD